MVVGSTLLTIPCIIVQVSLLIASNQYVAENLMTWFFENMPGDLFSLDGSEKHSWRKSWPLIFNVLFRFGLSNCYAVVACLISLEINATSP